MALLSDAELLARLVAFDTVSAKSNLPIVDFLRDYLERPGVVCELLTSPDGGKANLLARVGEEAPDGAGLVLCGHLDVVPPGAGWTSDPFTLTRRDGRWVGRGACDMKGFVALAANAAAAADPRRLAAPLCLLFTYDEEVGSLGARHFAAGWPSGRPLPASVVVGEPTGLRAVGMHKGHLRLRLSLRGMSAHSAYPHLGASAIAPAGPAISALSALGEALAAESPPAGAHFPDVPYVALNIGRIEGGRAVNMVPDACVLDLGLRTLPGTDADRLEERVRETLAPVLPPGRWRLERRGETPPFAGAADSALYRELAALLGQERPASVAFSTDAGWLATLGLDCVVWGPGSIAVAHQPDEHLEEGELAAARPLLEKVVERFCHGGRPAAGGEGEGACGAR